MSVIIILIIFSVLVSGGFLIAFIWAVNSGQYDDTQSPAVRILFDDQTKDNKIEDHHDENKTSGKNKNNSESKSV
jgi:cbb3-type cytochrome oxidase maturation protein